MASIFTHRLEKAVAIHSAADPRLLVASWWRSDSQPFLPSIEGFEVWRCINPSLIATLSGISAYEASKRLGDGHRLYLGWYNDQPVAYGWSATRQAEIGEIGCRFALPSSDRYLWDFATLPEWRGHSFYPRLIQAILAAEAEEATRFWIAYLPNNHASERGIAKAGFYAVGAVIGADDQLRLQLSANNERGLRGADLLGLPRSRRSWLQPTP